MEWEEIEYGLYRTMIPGGWLVKYQESVVHNIPEQGMINGWDYRTSICFVPDELHVWKVKINDSKSL